MNEPEIFLQQALVLFSLHLLYLYMRDPSQIQITYQNIQGLSSNNFHTLPPPRATSERNIYT